MKPEEFETLNWVQRRAFIERDVAPAFWDKIRAAVQDAVASFKEHYPRRAQGVECQLENGLRLLVTRAVNPNDSDSPRQRLIMSFYESDSVIQVATNRQNEAFSIGYDLHRGPHVRSKTSRQYTPDEFSELVLSAFLFQTTQP